MHNSSLYFGSNGAFSTPVISTFDCFADWPILSVSNSLSFHFWQIYSPSSTECICPFSSYKLQPPPIYTVPFNLRIYLAFSNGTVTIFALPLLNLYSALIFGISAKKYVSSHLHNGCAVAYSSTLSPIFILNGIKKLTSPFTSIGGNSTFSALITAFSISASSVNLW